MINKLCSPFSKALGRATEATFADGMLVGKIEAKLAIYEGPGGQEALVAEVEACGADKGKKRGSPEADGGDQTVRKFEAPAVVFLNAFVRDWACYEDNRPAREKILDQILARAPSEASFDASC